MDSPPFVYSSSTDADARLSAPLSSALSTTSLSGSERYIVTHVGAHQLVFPAHWVTEILLVERSQVLPLPFYDPILLGVVHHHGQMIPLVAIWQVLEQAAAPIRETLSVVQLNKAADRLAGVGIVVDRASDNRVREQLPADLFSPPSQAEPDSPDAPPCSGESIQIFHPNLLPEHLWQPQRWRQPD